MTSNNYFMVSIRFNISFFASPNIGLHKTKKPSWETLGNPKWPLTIFDPDHHPWRRRASPKQPVPMRPARSATEVMLLFWTFSPLTGFLLEAVPTNSSIVAEAMISQGSEVNKSLKLPCIGMWYPFEIHSSSSSSSFSWLIRFYPGIRSQPLPACAKYARPTAEKSGVSGTPNTFCWWQASVAMVGSSWHIAIPNHNNSKPRFENSGNSNFENGRTQFFDVFLYLLDNLYFHEYFPSVSTRFLVDLGSPWFILVHLPSTFIWPRSVSPSRGWQRCGRLDFDATLDGCMSDSYLTQIHEFPPNPWVILRYLEYIRYIGQVMVFGCFWDVLGFPQVFAKRNHPIEPRDTLDTQDPAPAWWKFIRLRTVSIPIMG